MQFRKCDKCKRIIILEMWTFREYVCSCWNRSKSTRRGVFREI